MAKKSFWKRGEDYARKVSGELIEQIKAGVAPWQKPWKPGEQSTPENFSTGKKYTGGNSLYLMSRAIREGRGDNRWGTYNQILAAGGQVRKGERGTQVLFFTDRTARAVKDEQGKAAQGPGRQDDLRGREAGKADLQAVHGVQCRAGRRVGVEAALYASTARMGCPPGRREGD